MAGSETKNLRVLIVDDDQSVLDFVQMLLKSVGYESVSGCLQASYALDLLEHSSTAYDVVLCDLDMPDMDGIEFLRHLSGTAFQGGVGIISGASARIINSVEQLTRTHNLRFLGYVEKRSLNIGNLLSLLGNLEKTRLAEASCKPCGFREWEIHQALVGKQILVHYQPKLCVTSQQVVGVEALARWRNSAGEMIGPDQFIPAAERYGLIDQLTFAVANQAIAALGRWQREGFNLKMSINLSSASLQKLSLPEYLMECLEAAAVEPGDLVLEITESQVLGELSAPIEILTRLCLRGMGLSIDDFGTGCSSLEQLNRLPFTELKLDKSFVQQAPVEESSRFILESSIQLARRLGMRVVAEGVEDRSMAELVEQLGCHEMQGYYFARPMGELSLTEWLRGYQQTPAEQPV